MTDIETPAGILTIGNVYDLILLWGPWGRWWKECTIIEDPTQNRYHPVTASQTEVAETRYAGICHAVVNNQTMTEWTTVGFVAANVYFLRPPE